MPRSYRPKDRSLFRTCSLTFAILAAILLAGLTGPGDILAQQVGNALVTPEQMMASLATALTGQEADLADLKIQLQELDALRTVVQAEIDTSNALDAAHAQLMLVPQLRIGDLENAIVNNQLGAQTLDGRIGQFRERLESTAILVQLAKDRIELARKQIEDVRQSNMPADQQQKLEATTQKLLAVLRDKNRLGERYMKVCGDLLDQLTAARDEKTAIGEKLANQLTTHQEFALFKRSNPYQRMNAQVIVEELKYCGTRIGSVFRATVWKAKWMQIKMGGYTRWVVFLTLLILILVLQGRSRKLLERIEENLDGPERYYRRLEVYMLRHSLFYLCMTLLFGIYSSFQFSLLNIGLGRVLFYAFLVLLMTRWGPDYLDHGFQGPPTGLRSFVCAHLHRFFKVFRAIALIGILLIWIAGRDSLLNWLFRIISSTGFMAWAWVFWRQMKPVVLEGVRDGQAAPNPKWIAFLKGWIYLVFGGVLIFSLAGYPNLGGRWSIAWVQTVALLFWAWISLKAIREWRAEHRARVAAADEDHPITIKYQWRWSLIQTARAVWLIVLAAGLLWSWDGSGILREKLVNIFNFNLTVGSLNFSIRGVVSAVIILFITHAVVRIGKTLLDQKILQRRALEPGLQDSILTITGYLGWGVGLLLVLAVIGINATSLAVVFGALSVGIGFGLQNIFNNFISGLILLFERPIQVGDYVEIGGLWAEVKKINVRATVVQTFDNASVIIPNSEFISQRVTNWSFKDKRMRRIMEIGVAYGSDIDLVQKTLLEIVQKRRRVLKFPKPDVLFVDHAASALIFRLRFWVHVDDFWTVPSLVRCEIDKRFRELDIEIAFPQQDVHIRSLPEGHPPPDSQTE